MTPPRYPRRMLAVALSTVILAAPMSFGPAEAQVTGQSSVIPPGTWLSVLVPVLLAMLLQTALGFRFLGKQEGRTDSLEKALVELKQEREADLKALRQEREADLIDLRDALRGMTAKLDVLSTAATSQDKGASLLEYRLEQIEKNTQAMLALREAFGAMQATMAEQHRATTEAFDKMDRRVTQATAQISHVASGKANSVQAFPAE